MANNETVSFVFACTTLVFATATAMGWAAYYSANKIPNVKEVQRGYVVPNKLEIELDDMDRNGEKEVILKYDGKPYLFKLDEHGKPVVLPYGIMFDKDYFKFEVKPLEKKCKCSPSLPTLREKYRMFEEHLRRKNQENDEDVRR